MDLGLSNLWPSGSDDIWSGIARYIGEIFCFHLQCRCLATIVMKKEAAGFPEMFVPFCETAQPHIPEDAGLIYNYNTHY